MKKKVKENLKKILLYFSTIPFIFAFCKATYHLLVGYCYETKICIYGFKAFFEVLADIVLNCTTNIGILFIYVVSLGYQIYYLIDVNNKLLKINFKCKKLNLDYKKILFYISFIPLVYILVHGIISAIFGYKIGFIYYSYIYGVDAFFDSVIMDSLTLSFIPVLPISIIYIIIYTVIMVRNKKYGK